MPTPTKVSKVLTAPKPRPLPDRQLRFIDEYLVDLNATQAVIRAGYSTKGAAQKGYELLADPRIAAAITAGKAKRAERTHITADLVLAQFWAIATADPNELIEHRRTCCRFCYGVNHRYQRTPNELATDRAAWEKTQTKSSKESFDEKGGDGWNATRDPHSACPECFGEGVERTFVHDTRRLSPSAKRLYAGVKTTKDGVEVKMHDQLAALKAVADHLGMFDTKDPGAPSETDDERARRIREELEQMDRATLGSLGADA
jgi:phage terminase small subunit